MSDTSNQLIVRQRRPRWALRVGLASVVGCAVMSPAAALGAHTDVNGVYKGTFSGTTYSFNGSDGKYHALAGFSRATTFLVEPHPSRKRSRTIGIFSGTPSVESAPGVVNFASNLYAYRLLGHLDAGSQLDMASVHYSRRKRTLNATVYEGNRARQSVSNLFHTDAGAPLVGASPFQVLAGTVAIRVSKSGQLLKAHVDLYGNRLIEPGNSFPVGNVEGDFRGRFRRYSKFP